VPGCNPWANSKKNLLFYPLPSVSSIIHQDSPLPNRGSPSLSLLSPLSKPMEILRFNQEKTSRLEAKGSPKAPLHFPLRVLWIPLNFFSPKVFKSSFCPISLIRAKI
jgi:hypothetical protein